MHNSNYAQITLKVDPQLKEKALNKAKKQGITLKALLTMAMNGYIHDELSFGLRSTESASQSTRDAIRDAEKDLQEDKVNSFKNVDEMIHHLQNISNS